VQHPFHGDLVSGLYQAADRIGYELALSAVTPARDEPRAVRSLLQDRCEALILLGPQAPTSDLADLAVHLPVVVVARAVRHRAVDVVRAAAARTLLDTPARQRPTAVIVFNDRCATGVLDVLHRAGLTVPGDISVIGYDDSRLARLSHVDLTTVAQDAEQMTTLAVTRAIDRLNGTPVAHRQLVIPPNLVVRGTTAAARATVD
jgi:DNA-binding LacI/PurR family transcriptional regulator